jgi:hypothetical protein
MPSARRRFPPPWSVEETFGYCLAALFGLISPANRYHSVCVFFSVVKFDLKIDHQATLARVVICTYPLSKVTNGAPARPKVLIVFFAQKPPLFS